MLFNSVHFFLFFPVVLGLHYGLPQPARRWLLLAASYYFYMWWNPKFILLLILLTAIDFAAALWIARADRGRRKLALLISLGANLGFLGFFKYYNFLARSLAGLLAVPGPSLTLDVILPVGISFHTFQSISYVVDVYRGVQPPIRNPIDYALYIAFFPQLVAGPIVRAREFFSGYYRWTVPTPSDVQRGVLLIVVGLVKKMVLADQFALIANAYFQQPAAHPGLLAAWSGAVAFALQVYFDFSGYSDIAIGSARLLGYQFPQNFRRPFLAASMTELWQRWHITLSRWLRDYVFLPLGGFRGSRLLGFRNLLITMLLGGLWHGAGWNYVVWGALHGLVLSAERGLGVRRARPTHPALHWPRVLATFALFSLSTVIFRPLAPDQAWWVIREMFTGGPGEPLILPWQAGLAALWMALEVAEERHSWFERLVVAPPWVFAGALAAMLFTLELAGVVDVRIPFFYYQF